jgi:hypothetical protein
MATSARPKAGVTPCPRIRGKIGLRELPKATQTQLFISSALALLIVSLVLLTPNLNVIQQFYLRIIIGLAAAGIAALIPGFFEIELSWLRNTLRAGGAIGIFLLIYGFNPPVIEQFDTLSELTGEVEYECTSLNGPFPHGGTKHGGIATIQPIRTRYGYALSISGDRKWIEKNEQRIPVNPPSTWQTISGNFTGDETLMYKYETIEQGTSYIGVSTLKIIKDGADNIIRLEGSFYRLPRSASDQVTYGTVVMRKKKR